MELVQSIRKHRSTPFCRALSSAAAFSAFAAMPAPLQRALSSTDSLASCSRAEGLDVPWFQSAFESSKQPQLSCTPLMHMQVLVWLNLMHRLPRPGSIEHQCLRLSDCCGTDAGTHQLLAALFRCRQCGTQRRCRAAAACVGAAALLRNDIRVSLRQRSLQLGIAVLQLRIMKRQALIPCRRRISCDLRAISHVFACWCEHGAVSYHVRIHTSAYKPVNGMLVRPPTAMRHKTMLMLPSTAGPATDSTQ